MKNNLTIQLAESSDYFRANIENFINSENFNINFGVNWYSFARKELLDELQKVYMPIQWHFSESEILLFASILSPANRWDKNIEDVINFIKWYHANFDESCKPKFCTYGQNVNKCIDLIQTRDKYKILNQWYVKGLIVWINTNMKAHKTLNFFKHLDNPKDSKWFTIDRHMLKISGIESLSITPKQYILLQEIYLEAFESMKDKFKYSSEFQSILWSNFVYQRHGILHY